MQYNITNKRVIPQKCSISPYIFYLHLKIIILYLVYKRIPKNYCYDRTKISAAGNKSNP